MIRGFDWASYQGQIDGEVVSRAGYAFAIGKATEDVDYVNPTHTTNTASIRASGMLVGHYHFLTRADPARQVDWFVQNANIQTDDLAAFDVEDDEGRQIVWAASDRPLVERAVMHFWSVRSFFPLVYSNQDVLRRLSIPSTSILTRCGLWLAAWQDADPTPVPPWEFVAFWQRRADVVIPGVNGSATQENLFNGQVARMVLYGQQ